MGLIYKTSDKDLLSLRNKIFTEVGISALERNGFAKSPFRTSWFGRNNLKDFNYEFCRISNYSQLEIVEVYISRGDKWIKIRLNIFELQPHISCLDELEGTDGIKFKLPPNSISEMCLRCDEYKGPPLLYMLFLPEHKIGRYYTKSGFNREVEKLKGLIKKDMENIDFFVKKWHELHKLTITDWEGNKKE